MPPSRRWARPSSTKRRKLSNSARRGSSAAQLLELFPAAGVGDVLGGEPGAAGGGDRVGHVVEGVDAVGVGVEDDLHFGFGGEAGVEVGEVAAVGVAVDLDHRAGPRRRLGDLLDVDAVGLAAADQAPGEVADAVDVRVFDRGDDAVRHLLFGDVEGGVDAGDDPVEGGDEVVGIVEGAVEADVDLRAGEEPEVLLAVTLVPGADLLDPLPEALGGDVVAEAVAGGVVGDRQVLIATVARRLGHLLDAVTPVGEGGVGVEVALEVADLDQLRQLAFARRLQLAAALAQLRLDVFVAEALVDL